jgi:hypothetical protein
MCKCTPNEIEFKQAFRRLLKKCDKNVLDKYELVFYYTFLLLDKGVNVEEILKKVHNEN